MSNTHNHNISLQDAAELTKNYRDQFSSGQAFIKGEMFDKTAMEEVLTQENCTAIRIYYGLKDTGEKCMVIVGVDDSGNDITEGQILEYGVICPPTCGNGNALNS